MAMTSPFVGQMLEQAMQFHQSGDLHRANSLYQEILRVNPGNADALHLSGIVALETGNYTLAEDLIGKAAKNASKNPFFQNTLGEVSRRQEKYQQAKKAYQRAVQLKPDYVQAWGNLGLVQHELGNVKEAIACYERVLRFIPGSPEALVNLGTAYQDLGQKEKAENCYKQALKADPGLLAAWINLGKLNEWQDESGQDLLEQAITVNAGNATFLVSLAEFHESRSSLDLAVRAYEQALKLKPDEIPLLGNLANLLQRQRKLEKAEGLYRKLIDRDPSLIPALVNLANVLQESGRAEESLVFYHQAAQVKQDVPEIYFNMGNALSAINRLEDAVEQYRTALALRPAYPEALNSCGIALSRLGRIAEAKACYEDALQMEPAYADVHNNLGVILGEQGALDQSMECFRKAIQFKPNFADAFNNLGMSLKQTGRLKEAFPNFLRALEIYPDFVDALLNMGNTCLAQGLVDEAIQYYGKALAIAPGFADGERCLLGALLYAPFLSLGELYARHIEFGSSHGGAKCLPINYSRIDLTYDRKLRIGYVSSDFRDHPVGRNLMPLIEGHDPNYFEIYLYGNVKKTDGMTERIIKASDGWRSIMGKTDAEAAEMIRSDKIDILVLLAGRFDDNRPLIAAYYAAPVQVSFHDPATSGLDSMDYLITDHVLSPRNSQEKFTERLIHLPTFYIHEPMNDAPDVNPLPTKERGYITFGSFNNPAKLNDQVIALWAQILHALPQSRLVLKYRGYLGDNGLKQRYLDMFTGHGISLDRLDLLGTGNEKLEMHLASYADIDIALDPFPFTGSTTTFESLWMGVPVITLMGDRMVSRWSGAMLRKAGLGDLIAESPDEYVEIAKKLAGDLEHLADLRAGLRDRVANSPLCDQKARTRQIERVYRYMWRKWCADQTNQLNP